MKVYAVITGDIKNFTKLADKDRALLIGKTEALLKEMVARKRDAQIFRGDSYQLQLTNITQAIKKSIQLLCWFKMNSDRENHISISTKISIGIGGIAYEGNNVLDSDGEAYHLSGRNFDKLEKEEQIRLTTNDEKHNKLYKVIFMFINMIAKGWTVSQAETIYQMLDMKDITQKELARQLKMSQPNIAKSLRAARWKEVESGISYINNELNEQYHP
jgi:hypothetical protein